MIHQAVSPGGVDWLYTAPDTPTCIVIDSGRFTGGVHPPKSVRL